MTDYIDNNVNPGDDFFKYATGKWLELNPQPAEYPVWQTFTKLHDENIKRISDIIQQPNDSVIGKKINIFYDIIMNDEKRQKDGNFPVINYINTYIEPISTKEEFLKFIYENHIGLLFSTYIDIDSKNSKWHCISCFQGGMTLGNKEYYISKDEDKVKIRKAFKKFIVDVLCYYNYDVKTAKNIMKKIISLETSLAKCAYSEEDLQNPSLNYHKYKVTKLSKEFNFDFKTLLDLYGYTETNEIVIGQIKPIKKACKLLNTLELEDLKNYLKFVIMNDYLNVLDDKGYNLDFEFSKIFNGATEQMPKWKRAVNTIDSVCEDAIAQIYVNKYFPESAKNKAEEMVKQLKTSFYDIISSQEWLSNNTKEKALEKLNRMRFKIGYPKKFEDLTEIPIFENVSYFDTLIALKPFFRAIDMRLHYNKPVDPDEWYMSPQTVNAYYNPVNNEIVFPAGILQPPFFSEKQTISENLGGIGVVIGHEMTHGFDNHGRQFDIDGNLKDWWNEEDSNKFEEYTEITKQHFNNLEVLPGLHCDGSLTLGENLADYGGLKIAYNALLNYTNNTYENGLSDKQIFFISYATVWAGINTEESIRTKTLNNEHSVNYMRVNGTLPMFTPWYTAFNIKETDKLYISKENRAKIW